MSCKCHLPCMLKGCSHPFYLSKHQPTLYSKTGSGEWMTFEVWLRSEGQQAAQCNFALAKRQERHSWVPNELPAELIIRIKIHVGMQFSL